MLTSLELKLVSSCWFFKNVLYDNIHQTKNIKTIFREVTIAIILNNKYQTIKCYTIYQTLLKHKSLLLAL